VVCRPRVIIVLLPATEQRLTLESHVTPEPNLELNCLVQGDNVQGIFIVRVNPSEAVYDLKKAIQRERKDVFEDVGAVKLMLWKFSVPIDDGLGKAICDNLAHEEQLGPLRLSKVFPIPPPPEHVHIVIKGQRSYFALKHILTVFVFALYLP
jgi:Crinkler effector protein N-terminal domain